ncbi:MAG TPA: hypothetical protein DD791_11350, partial [Syntrophomonas sp.]|nr:hypothetical protein [Syntrophomonas sp.]
VAILGRGEFCKVVGEGLLPDYFWHLYHYPVKDIIYTLLKKNFLYDKMILAKKRAKKKIGEYKTEG